MSKLYEESAQYKDIILANHMDNFHNNSWKLEMMYEWGYKYCDYEFILKVDDDNYINMKNLFNLIKTLPKTGIYLGRLFKGAEVYRGGKYAVTYEQYPMEVYPHFVTGGAVLMSYDVARDIIPYFEKHPFKLEDVYVGMLVANVRNITGRHSSLFQHSWGSCVYNNDAISLHFANRKKKNELVCLKECQREMEKKNRNDPLVQLHYIDNDRRKNRAKWWENWFKKK